MCVTKKFVSFIFYTTILNLPKSLETLYIQCNSEFAPSPALLLVMLFNILKMQRHFTRGSKNSQASSHLSPSRLNTKKESDNELQNNN